MTEYACWFCGKTIEQSDAGAVMITLENLWRWQLGSRGEDDPCQSIYAHSACAKSKIKGPTKGFELEPSTFLEDDDPE